MKIRKPDYYDRFQCVAGACKDSCCIGWEIDVDEEKQNLYRSVDGVLGERLKTCINWEKGHFILQGKEERCPFLNKDNLCDLIIGIGEESLCEICREHPRFYEWYENLTEIGVGLCCEEAARLMLEREDKLSFIVEEDGNDTQTDVGESFSENDDTVEVLMQARETAYAILQNRTVPIWERLKCFLTYIEELQQGLDFENLDEIEESAEYYCNVLEDADAVQAEPEECAHPFLPKMFYLEQVKICRELEPIDEAWPATIDLLEQLINCDDFSEVENEMDARYAARDYEYEHLAVYFVFRYFMKCRTDGDVYSKGMLLVFCIALIHLLDLLTYKKNGKLTKEDRAWNAKNCSKEIEYSEENLDALAEIFWERDLLYKS